MQLTRRFFRPPLTWLFVLAFLVFLITSNVRVAFNSPALYELGFTRHNVDGTTGLTISQLSEAGHQIREYFRSDKELLDLRITVNDQEITLFKPREIIHMRDVKELLHLVYRAQEGAFLFLFLFVTIGFVASGNEFGGPLRRLLAGASMLTIAAVVVAALASVVAFGPLFFWFHQLSFSNDFWILDPATSYLVRMFPQRFWFESTVLVGTATVLEALGVLTLLLLVRWWNRWTTGKARRKEPKFTFTAQDVTEEGE